jgi:hypothetical protein
MTDSAILRRWCGDTFDRRFIGAFTLLKRLSSLPDIPLISYMSVVSSPASRSTKFAGLRKPRAKKAGRSVRPKSKGHDRVYTGNELALDVVCHVNGYISWRKYPAMKLREKHTSGGGDDAYFFF